MLGQRRLPNEEIKAIIPIMVRTSNSLPSAMSRVQFIDLSGVTVRGRRYYTTQEFKEKVKRIIESIEKIAVALVQNESKPNCERFQFPSSSAFGDYQPQNQPLPFRNR
jgi:hypothetical protein